MKERGEEMRSLIPLNLDGYLFSDQWKSGKVEQVRSRMSANFIGWEIDDARFYAALEH